MQTVTITTRAELKKVAQNILNSFEDSVEPVVLALHGDLGVGKTTFVQELAAHMGVMEVVTSPTFVVMKQYETDHQRFTSLVHIDAYRIEDQAEAGPLGLKELFQHPHTLICIEWPEKIEAILPLDTHHLTLTHTTDNKRTLTIT